MAATLVFLGATSANGSQLFELGDAGATAVDLAGYPVGGNPVSDLTPFASGLYFSGGSGAATGLWVLHGASSPATLLSAGLSADLDPTNLTAVGVTLFFSGLDPAGKADLYVTNGTASGTTQLVPAGAAASGLAPNWFASLGGKLYFSGRDSGGSADLWVSDGTVAGTTALAVANTDTNNIGGFGPGLDPSNIAAVNGRLFLSGYDAAGLDTLWVSDGTAAGTTEIRAAGAAAAGLAPTTSNIAAFGGKAWFAGTDSANRIDLWSSDGTAAGTAALAVAGAGSQGITPVSLTVFNGALFFGGVAADGTVGLWKADGTSAGTVQLAVAGAGAGGLSPLAVDSTDSPDVAMTVFNGRLYFAANGADGTSGLWSSDGTAAGTVPVGVAGAAASGLLPSDFAVLDLAAAAGTVPAATGSPGTPVTALPAGSGTVVTPNADGSGSVFLTPVGGQSLVATTATGNDVVNSRGTDTVNAGGGTTVVYASGASATVNGGAGTLVFVAGAGNYTAGGGTGANVLYGGAGNDVLTGGGGVNSILVAGAGNTTLVGGAGRAALMYGGVGSSSFTGSTGGGDTMVGGGGGNVFFMTDGDIAFGGATGPDVFNAGTGSALIVEGPGSSAVVLGGGAATAFAGTGSDTYTVTQGVGGSAAIVGFKAGDHIFLSGYAGGEAGAALAGASTGSFGTALRLSDGTRITLFGVALVADQISVS